MKNKENYVENLVVQVQKLFGNEIVWSQNGLRQNWQCRKVLFPDQ